MEELFKEEDVVYTYTSDQAEEDGILFDVTKVKQEWSKGLFKYITTNLLGKGYFTEDGDEISIPNILDLLNQALEIVRKKSNGFQTFDTFFSGTIELPSGARQKIFIVQNETGKFTLMLPEDY